MARLSASQQELYWNVFRNMQKGIASPSGFDINREQLTYIQADPRYIEYLTDYLATTPGISDSEKNRIRAEAQANHDSANVTLDDPGYYYSPTLTGLANDFYTAIENNDRATLGDLALAPQIAALPPTEEIRSDAATPSILPDPSANLTVTPILPEDFRRAAVTPVETPALDVAALPAVEATPNAPLEITVTNPTLIQWPIAGTLIHEFGQDLNGKPNTGVNIAAPLGTDVRASANGTVFHVGESDERGKFVILQHTESNFSVYSHLDSVSVAEGDTIARDQAFAKVGQTGDVTSPQLHFEMRIGTDRAPTDPVVELGGPPPQPATTDYTVAENDSLWSIAKKEFGLTRNADIQRAVEHIAQINGLSEGVSANHLSIGQPLKLPQASALSTPATQPLNWAALDADTRGGSVQVAQSPRFQRDATGTEQIYAIGQGGSLSRTIFAAARDQGITIDRSKIGEIIARVAEGNGIDNPDVVSATQQVRVTRDMFGAAPA